MEISLPAFVVLWQLMFIKSSGSQKIIPLLVPHEREANLQPITWNCVKRAEASKKWKFLQSKGYPKLLNVKESRCSWKIITAKGSRVKLAFRGMDLYADDPAHCSANYVEIIDETLKKSQARYCGKSLPGDIVSHGNRIRVDFQAQSGIDTSTKGFSIAFARTSDVSGFYRRQSFGKRPTPRPTRPPRRNIPIDVKDFKDSREEQSGGGSSTSIEVIIGIIIAIIAVAIIGFIVWKKREKVLQFMKDNDKKTTSSSLDAYPAPPQNKVDPFERIMEVVEPFPPPPSEKSEDNRSTYVNCQPPPLPYKNRVLPGIETNHFPVQNDHMMLGCSSRNHGSSASIISSRVNFPPRYTSNSSYNNKAVSRGLHPIRSPGNSGANQPTLQSHRTRSRDFNPSAFKDSNTLLTSNVSHDNVPSIPPRSSKSYTKNNDIGSVRQPLTKKYEANSDLNQNLSIIHDPIMEKERMRRLKSRESNGTWASTKLPFGNTPSNQHLLRNKLYLPEKPLPAIPSNSSSQPPPLPPKTRSVLLFHDEEPPRPWLDRAPSRCSSRADIGPMSELHEFETFPRTRSTNVSKFSGVRPRCRSISDLTEISRSDFHHAPPANSSFNRNNRMRATVGSRVSQPRNRDIEPPLPPRDDLRENTFRSFEKSTRLSEKQRDTHFETKLPSRSSATIPYKERRLLSSR